MKKFSLKLPRKKAPEQPSRITNETVAEHRERILAGGKKFKYPVQYARHKLVINAIIIAVAAIVLFFGVVWWLLYQAQNTSTFMYRLTKVVPFPVASVDGTIVRYSDYLMYYNMSAYYLKTNEQLSENTPDGQVQVAYIKDQTMDLVIKNTYAKKLAKELSITVSDEEIDAVIANDRTTGGGVISEETYNASAKMLLNLDPDEYRYVTKNRLLLKKVQFAIDETAKQQVEMVTGLIADGQSNIEKIMSALGDDPNVISGTSGKIAKTGDISGLASTAAGQKKGAISGPIEVAARDGDSYYFVKTLEVTDTTVSYEYIRISLTELDRRVAELISNDKVREYIKVELQQEE